MVPESDLLEQVRTLARATRWMTFHPHDSRRSEPGWPDLALVRPPRLVFAELKRERGRVSRDQQAWLDALAAVTQVDVYVWRPSDAARILEALR
jgi:hypothetical protein